MRGWITEKTFLLMSVDKPTRADLGLPEVDANQGFAKDILAVAFGMIGALAVVTIIIGSMNLAKSGGNPEEISKAKKTIMYSVIGLIVALLAEALVFFVIGKL